MFSGSERTRMDVSDTKLIFEIYLTISGMGNSRREQSIDQFKIQLIAGLRKIGCKISAIDEIKRLYLLNAKIILYFSPSDDDLVELYQFLYRVLLMSNSQCRIAYGIRNESGACIYRVEIPD